MLHTLIGGLLFGAVYYYMENIFTSVVMHAVTNVVVFLPMGYLFALIGTETGCLPVALLQTLAGLVILLCVSVFFTGVCERAKRKWGGERLNNRLRQQSVAQNNVLYADLFFLN